MALCKYFFFFYLSLLELCENLPMEGRETIIMNQILPYIKVNLTLVYFLFHFALYEGKPDFSFCLYQYSLKAL